MIEGYDGLAYGVQQRPETNDKQTGYTCVFNTHYIISLSVDVAKSIRQVRSSIKSYLVLKHDAGLCEIGLRARKHSGAPGDRGLEYVLSGHLSEGCVIVENRDIERLVRSLRRGGQTSVMVRAPGLNLMTLSLTTVNPTTAFSPRRRERR